MFLEPFLLLINFIKSKKKYNIKFFLIQFQNFQPQLFF